MKALPRLDRRALVLALACVPLAGCKSAGEYSTQADKQVYAILEQRYQELVENPAEFRLEPPEDSLRQQLLRGEEPEEDVETLSLAECLRIAAENSREYRTRKEQLYLVALDLTFERWQYSNQYGLFGAAFLDGTGEGITSRQLDANGTLTRVLGTGAEVVADVGLSVFKNLLTGDSWETVGDVGLAITQPLMRGAGREVALEPLTQAERDTLYAVRSFERFRQTFAFDVADRMYRILQQMDTVDNERNNYVDLVRIRERNEALGDAGRLDRIQVDQARQDELRAENRLLLAEQGLDRQLDSFKLFLGLPVETRIGVDRSELETLRERGLDASLVEEAFAYDVALNERLDYLTIVDRVEDGERQVRVSSDALRAGLDVTTAISASSSDGQPFRFSRSDVSWTLGFDLDLPVDRLAERNAYRATEIGLDVAVRAEERLGDEILAEIRDSIRLLEAARESYEIQRVSVDLAQARIDSTQLKLEAGRAETRDLLEAQADYLDARNALTAAIVEYTLSTLTLNLDMGLLRVDEAGISVDVDRLLEHAGVERDPS
jgi:outer membrane protein TolC